MGIGALLAALVGALSTSLCEENRGLLERLLLDWFLASSASPDAESTRVVRPVVAAAVLPA